VRSLTKNPADLRGLAGFLSQTAGGGPHRSGPNIMGVLYRLIIRKSEPHLASNRAARSNLRRATAFMWRERDGSLLKQPHPARTASCRAAGTNFPGRTRGKVPPKQANCRLPPAVVGKCAEGTT
jgi:hypothetical protein